MMSFFCRKCLQILFFSALGGVSGGELSTEVRDGGDQAGLGLHQAAAGLCHTSETKTIWWWWCYASEVLPSQPLISQCLFPNHFMISYFAGVSQEFCVRHWKKGKESFGEKARGNGGRTKGEWQSEKWNSHTKNSSLLLICFGYIDVFLSEKYAGFEKLTWS